MLAFLFKSLDVNILVKKSVWKTTDLILTILNSTFLL
jgi:hypothetical protein